MRKPLFISILCVAAALLLLFLGFQPIRQQKDAPQEDYALLIQSDTGSFVMQLQKGMQQAAKELGVRLLVRPESEMEQLPAVSGVALWLSNPKAALGKLQAADMPAVVVGQQRTDAVYVTGDDDSAGKQLIRFAMRVVAPEQAVLLVDDEDAHAAARSASALVWARAQGAVVMTYAQGLTLPGDAKAVVCTSLRATQDMAAQKQAGAFAGMVMGIDMGEERVEALESGLVTAMALDSPYAMGYLAMQRLYTLRKTGAAESAFTGVLLATQENMYESENVKQVFPLLN